MGKPKGDSDLQTLFRFRMPSAPYPPSDVLARTLVQRSIAAPATPALRGGRHRQRTRSLMVSFRIRASGTRRVLESRGDAADRADVDRASRASFCAQGIRRRNRRSLRSATRRCRKWAPVAVSLVRRRESRTFRPDPPARMCRHAHGWCAQRQVSVSRCVCSCARSRSRA